MNPKMIIHNVRLGLATNSSSTHSLIFLPGAKDYDATDAQGAYGWGNFTLATKGAKRDYLAASIYSFLKGIAGDDVALTVAREWSGGGEVTKDSYVDHQSEITFPRDWKGQGLDREFVMEFRDLLMTDGVTVLGGNDNDDEGHPLQGAGKNLNLRRGLPHEDRSCWVARKDSSGFWTMFNRETGAKLRVSLTKDGIVVKPTKSDAPELVDVKITNYCPFGCPWCYQDSTPEGEHADVHQLRSLAYKLEEKRVFEVAIGGGEPTMHPQFAEILRTFYSAGIVANFTTKNWAWLGNKNLRQEILAHAGAFAFSCENAADVRKLAGLVDTGIDPSTGIVKQASVQFIVGKDTTAENLEGVLRACAEHHLRVTLLGYKTAGRGDAFGEKPSAGWLEVVKRVAKETHLHIGIDTALADKWWDALIKAGVPEWCMTRKEGAFSCYIDAVKGTIARSSYEGEGVKLDAYYEDVCEKFAAL